MKYIIIGLVILYISVPSFMALDLAYSASEFLYEWWDAFKEFAPMMTIILAMLTAAAFILYGAFNL